MTVASTNDRTDPLPVFPNTGKARALRVLREAWRDAAETTAAHQWRRFFEMGYVRKNLSANQDVAAPALCTAKQRIGAQRLQMVRYQVVGTLQSFLSNRQNDFRQIVERSSLDGETKHQLHSINKRQAWFDRRDVVTKNGTVVPGSTQKLARRIMRHVLTQHRRPSFKN
mgnify:CR=1 FL=1